jgi:asparagine synthase (glutamine-hydrolysing)
MARHSSQVRTFTVGFAEGGDANEIDLAALTARLFGTSHESVLVDAGEYIRRLPESLAMIEEPVGSSSALASHYVAELMQPSVPVALSGQGADEPLGGYWRHLGTKLADRARRVPGASPTARYLARMPGPERVRRGLSTLAAKADLDLLMSAYEVFGESDKQRLYGPAMKTHNDGMPPRECVDAIRSRVAGLDLLSQMLYVDTRFWLPNELLLIADKTSMAASVELRVPFLDEDLVAFVERIDSSEKVHGLSRKWIHKRAMLKWLPREIVYRRERGWATPMARWLRTELRPLLEEALLADGALPQRLFEPAELRRLIDSHGSGAADHTRRLFCLLSLGLWAQAFEPKQVL